MCTTRVLDRPRSVRDNMHMANRIAHLRVKAGLTQQQLADLLHSGRSTVTKLERGERPLNDNWLEKFSDIFGCSKADILGEIVPIIGKIGAGGSVIFDDMGVNETDTVPRPPETEGSLIALEVSGESMMPKFDPGDVIYISRDQEGLDSRALGNYCAIRLRTGETYLKRLVRGSSTNRFTLRSLNAADIEDVEIEWATPIRAILPKGVR